jgi:hypothetical protein
MMDDLLDIGPDASGLDLLASGVCAGSLREGESAPGVIQAGASAVVLRRRHGKD